VFPETAEQAQFAADSSRSPHALASNLPPHCRLSAAHRAPGVAVCGRLKLQLTPSALRPSLPAASAVPLAQMQATSRAAGAIPILNFITRRPLNCRKISAFAGDDGNGNDRSEWFPFGPVLA
jgi:hypothetical protein